MSEKLRVEEITQSYKEIKTIERVSLTLQKGEIVSLLGVSGVGKSTLFHVICGLTRPDEGAVFLDGRDITGCPGEVGYMLQKDMLLPFKTVLDNCALPLLLSGEKKKAAHDRVRSFLTVFGLEGCEQKYPGQLSGGMRQRAALLRTLLLGRDLFLLDEPFSALDAITRAQMQEWYLEISEAYGLTTLLITHDINEALRLSGRMYLLTGTPGRVTQEVRVGEDRESVEKELRAALASTPGRKAV